jgi:hypothetical protein
MPPSGELEKLTIQAFTKPDYSDPAPVGEFKAFVNPNEITASYEYEWDRTQATGTTGARMTFKAAKPGDMALAFFLDDTGAGGRTADVQGMVKQFQAVTGYAGGIHRPLYLKVMWGTLQVRRCVLKSASIAYKLFTPAGVPLRAVITAAFSDNSDDKTRVATAQDQSADLTHRRVIRAGDDLPRLCEEIYGDPRLYLKVAAANRLDDFRALAPGAVVFFPPLET